MWSKTYTTSSVTKTVFYYFIYQMYVLLIVNND